MGRNWTREQIEDIDACYRQLADAALDAGFNTLSPDDQELVLDLLRARIRDAVRVNAESRKVRQ